METVLITGASSGIGYELAKIFASNKYNLVLTARNITELNKLKEELEKNFNINVLVISKDLSVPGSSNDVFDEIKKAGIEIDYLVNNAGFGDFGFFYECNREKQEQMINLNITSLTQLTRLFLPAMISKGKGKIMNVASTASFQPGPLMSVYYATKAYVLSFSEAIANELKGTGVTVTALCPGPTKSGFQKVANIEKSRLVKGRIIPTSEVVAMYGYKAMMKGKVVAIHGFTNKILAFMSPRAPKWMIIRILRKMNEERK
jgi:short-subunit dehydrogenase